MPILSVNGLVKSYEVGVPVVRHLDLQVDEGEIVSLLGPSGCGKTTSLRCISGLERPDAGEIVIDGATVYSDRAHGGVWVPPERRGLAMVFQQYALWPHLDVYHNVAFGLETKKVPRAQIPAAVETALKRVRLWHLRDRRISQLSGGQQQRIALARALAIAPKLVLFDEPLSNLDAKLREEMREELVELQRQVGFTAVYVTHDQDEAFSLSSRIIVMNQGVAEQVGTPSDIWASPATEFVADFVGAANKLGGTVESVDGAHARVVTDLGPEVTIPRQGVAVRDRVTVYMRSGSLELTPVRAGARGDGWQVPVLAQSFHGTHTTVQVGFGSGSVSCLRPNEVPTTEEHLWLRIATPPLVFPEAAQADEAAA